MKIEVTFNITEDDEYADPDHEMGVNNEGYEYLMDVIPGDDIKIRRVS